MSRDYRRNCLPMSLCKAEVGYLSQHRAAEAQRMRFFARTFAVFTDLVGKQMKAQAKDSTYSLTSLADVSLSASQMGFTHLKA